MSLCFFNSDTCPCNVFTSSSFCYKSYFNSTVSVTECYYFISTITSSSSSILRRSLYTFRVSKLAELVGIPCFKLKYTLQSLRSLCCSSVSSCSLRCKFSFSYNSPCFSSLYSFIYSTKYSAAALLSS